MTMTMFLGKLVCEVFTLYPVATLLSLYKQVVTASFQNGSQLAFNHVKYNVTVGNAC